MLGIDDTEEGLQVMASSLLCVLSFLKIKRHSKLISKSINALRMGMATCK